MTVARVLAGLAGAGLALSLPACRPRSSESAAPAAAPVGGPSAWELVYEREVAGNLDLYVIPAGGGPEHRLTDHPAGDMLGRWSPDGRTVVFSSERSGNWQLWEVPGEGGSPRRLRTNAAREFQSDPSPDGRQIAFLSNLEGPECLFVMDRGTGAARRLVRHGDQSILGNPHWSPDGKLITFSSNWRLGHQIYVVDPATGEGPCTLRFRLHYDGSSPLASMLEPFLRAEVHRSADRLRQRLADA